MSNKKIGLMVIDPQIDFVSPNGALYVDGAEKNIMNVVTLVDKIGHKFHDIDITLDSHHLMHIANPLFWVNSFGEHPKPFTIISADDVKKGKWRAVIPTLQKWAVYYTEKLEENQRYQLCVWPPHCLIGSEGNNIYKSLCNSLINWETKYNAVVNKTAKGSNIKTEHYSAVKADVTDPEDNGTTLNTRLIERVEKFSMLLLAGWANSHCLKFTCEDMIDNFGADSIKNVYLMTDCMNPVKGFEKQAEDFLNNMEAKGVNLVTSAELLKGGI